MQKSFIQNILRGIILFSPLHVQMAFSDDYFDPSFIEGVSGQNQHVDLSVFNAGGQVAGAYDSAIYLNNNYVTEKKIQYDYSEGSNQLLPLLTKLEYIEYGVLPNATPNFMSINDNDVIKEINKFIPDAFTKYNFEKRRLEISIPQKYIKKVAQGTVPESQWNDGISALFANYTYSGSSTKTDGISEFHNSSYLNLRSGLNIGSWRLRNYSTYSKSNNIAKWNSIKTYIESNVKSLKSQLVIGDSYTPSDMFDSFSFLGVQLASDDAMQPSSMRGFAPIVRGVAKTNAQVTIRQNGNTILQTYVSPGPFIINDLYPTSSSGDLEVTIKETDGSTTTFIQPFSSVPIMLREGRFKYSLTAGEYRSRNASDKKPFFLQSTGIYGLPYNATAYGGLITSEKYNALLLGLGKSLNDIGSISFDATIANSQIMGKNYTGESFRFQYSKEVLSTGTSFSLAGYRYSTSKYRDFSQTNGYYDNSQLNSMGSSLNKEDAIASYQSQYNSLNKRDKLQLSINQDLGDFGSMYLTGYQQKYWNNSGKERNLNFGYNKNYNGVNYSFNYSYSKDMYYGNKNQIFSFTVQIPLDFIRSNTWLNLSNSSDKKGNNTSLVGFSGTALENNNFNYSIQEGYNKRDSDSTGNVSVGYKASFGEYQLGYNYTHNTQQVNYSAMGGVVIHPNGVTFSQPLGETFALVRAKDASNIDVKNNPGISTDYWGNAIVPYVSPYQRNNISLDTTNLSSRIDLASNIKTVVPTRGAIVMAEYHTIIGYKMFVTLVGENIPFGAEAKINNNGVASTGIVDDNQKVYLSGAPTKGIIHISWGDNQCNAPYEFKESQEEIISFSVQCN
ncbi:fimbria/pilus outer membrane usher protein [Orbus wheelerorum]|uniref:fimbria/pilus outer membrane usher protein n=1 Tax=Orbus wheelerorum TaxID=3074111 RepID=UPI00370D51ED